MQRMKQLALGAFSMTLATAGVAHAGGDREHGQATDQGGRSSQPAPHTGSGAPSDPAMNRSSSSGQGASTMASSGMNRSQIEQMQRELASRGLYSGAIDGMAGPQTMAALQQFQEQQGLPASGSFDDATRRALCVQLDKQTVSGAQTSSGPELERPVGREGGTPSVSGAKPMRSQVQLERLNPAQLRTLQTRLSELGFYQGSVDGVLGEATRAGLRQFFQTQADLASRGIITDATVSLFGVSPQGLNPPTGSSVTSSPATGSPATGNSTTGTNPSWGTQPRGGETRDGANQPSGTSTPRQGTTPMPQPTNPSQGTH
jgi:peptidoglycan hydrolase-like protein with peptidoglycan-binding domain